MAEGAEPSSGHGVRPEQVIGRYALYAEIAAGGMATVHLGRLVGAVGFTRLVAIKRLHKGFARDPEFVAMFVDEARMAARIRHPNVVPTLDVVSMGGDLLVVLEYVHGESLSRLLHAGVAHGGLPSPPVVAAILAGSLHGLHAAHEAKNEKGEPLELVHRDVSPQNVLVGVDGAPRVLDFGVAKAVGRLGVTRQGVVKGKLAYMAPEQIDGAVTRRSDVFAAGVVLWEALAGKRLFTGENDVSIAERVRTMPIERPSAAANTSPGALDAVALQALSRDPAERFATAREMALAIEASGPLASSSEVGRWVEQTAHAELGRRQALVSEVERSSTHLAVATTSIGDAPPKEGAPVASLPTVREGHGRAMDSAETATPLRRQAEPPPPRRADEPATKLSHASETRAPAPTSPRRTALLIAASAAAGVIAVWLFVAISAYRVHEDGTGAVSSSAPLAPSPPAPPSAAGTAVPSVEPSPAPSPPAAPPSTLAPASPSSAPRPHPTASPRPHAPPAACDPPFSVDTDGHKHFKAECLP